MSKGSLKSIRTLSVRQPWATAITSHGKNIENRPRIAKMRGYFAIHASMTKDKNGNFEYLKDQYRISIEPDKVPFGAIVGFAKLSDVVTRKTVSKKQEKWFSGKFGYVLEDVIKLKVPIEATGALGFWKLKGSKLKACLDQLTSSQRKKVESFPLDYE